MTFYIFSTLVWRFLYGKLVAAIKCQIYIVHICMCAWQKV